MSAAFIRLTLLSGEPYYLNVNAIAHFVAMEGGTYITLRDAREFRAKESFEEVQLRIERRLIPPGGIDK